MNIRDWIFLIAVGAIGLSFLVFVLQAVRYGRLYEKTTGTVRLIHQYKDTDNVTKYQAYYIYRDEAGRKYEGRSAERANYSRFTEGEQVSILYLKEDPQKSTINSFRERYAWSLFLAGFSIFLFVCSILSALRPN